MSLLDSPTYRLIINLWQHCIEGEIQNEGDNKRGEKEIRMLPELLPN